MARYRASLSSPDPPEQVFADLCRFDHAARWDPGVESASMLTPEPVGPGSRFRLLARFLGRTLPLEYEIIDFDLPNRVVFRAETPTFRSIDTITFVSGAGGGTAVTYDAVLEGRGPLRIADPIVGLVFGRIGDRAADGLRAYLDPARTP